MEICLPATMGFGRVCIVGRWQALVGFGSFWLWRLVLVLASATELSCGSVFALDSDLTLMLDSCSYSFLTFFIVHIGNMRPDI